MKHKQQQDAAQHTKFNDHKNRPEIRDDMDSREGEEQETKGDDITHNKKENKSKKPGQHQKQ